MSWQSGDLGRSGLNFARLPGTRLEGKRIAELLHAQLFLDKEALERSFKKVRSLRLLHIASHGFFLTRFSSARASGSGNGLISITDHDSLRFLGTALENPLLRSGLALAGANKQLRQGTLLEEVEDGILNAEDVTGLDLLATELVVLSACDTGLGEVQVGDGVFGLRRAFQLAGARTLVMSLGKVPDRETQELMEDFQRQLSSGEGRAGALRQAQLAMQKKNPDIYY